jgi:hypothetical protein
VNETRKTVDKSYIYFNILGRNIYTMKLRLLISFVLVIFTKLSIAQSSGKIQGRVLNINKQSLSRTNILLTKATDAKFAERLVSNEDGSFQFNKLSLGTYLLNVTHIGYIPSNVEVHLTEQKMVAVIQDITLYNGAIHLDSVTVKTRTSNTTVRKDTVEFNASSFKTQINDNVEELLKKIPGLEIDRSGRVTAQGKLVSKVLVDGKEFFGNDPKAATKNLPADAVSKVQVIDDKTEKAKNTGIEDGQREKVINLKLKDDKKQGWFGNTSVLGDGSDRYLTQASINRFNDKKQFSLIFLSNNINESGFSIEDLNSFSGGNAFNFFSSGAEGNSINISSSGRFNINGVFNSVTGGKMNVHSVGLNYADELGKKRQFKYNINVVAVLSNNELSQISDIQDPVRSGYLRTIQTIVGENRINNYRFNFNLDYQLDSLTNFKFRPGLLLSNRRTRNDSQSSLMNQEGLASAVAQLFDQKLESPTLTGYMTINRRLPNRRGVLNLSLNGNYVKTNSNYLNTLNLTYDRPNLVQEDSSANNNTSLGYNSKVLSSTFTFVKPLNLKKKINLTIAQLLTYRKDLSLQATYEYNPLNQNFEVLVPNLTGDFNSSNFRFSGIAGISKSGEKFTSSFNIELAQTNLRGSSDRFEYANVDRRNVALIPTLYLSYSHKSTNFYISLKSNVTSPAITDLQPLFNNTNPLYVRLGNPDLKFSRNVSINSSFSSMNSSDNSYLSANFNFQQYWNGYSTSTTVNEQLVQTVQPINVNGNKVAAFDLSLNKPAHMKGLRYSLGTGMNFAKTNNFINTNKNISTKIAPNINSGVNYDGASLSLSLRITGAYTKISNSGNNIGNLNYILLNNYYKLSWNVFKSLRLFSDLYQTNYLAQQGTPNTSLLLLQSGLEQFLTKKRQLSLTLGAFDLLNQNSGIQRTAYATGRIESTETNSIGRYFYVKLNYKLNKLGAASNNSSNIKKF